MPNITTRFLIAIIFYCTPALSTEQITDDTTVLSKKLVITTDSATCYLHTGSKTIKLAPEPPCYFLTDSSHTPQQYAYKDVNVDAVIVITGSLLDNEFKKQWGITENTMCWQDAQGILFKNGQVMVTKNVLTHKVICNDVGLNENNFWYFAHNTE